MTIRQHGGVFGRNPKFNSLDVDNDTQIDGDISSQIASGVDGVHIARSTGSATPTPVELRLQTKTNAGDWSTSNPWGRISLFSQDTSGGGGKIHASIEAIAAHSSGGRSKLSLKTSSSSADDLQDALVLDPDTGSGRNVTVSDGNLVIGTSGNGIDFSATSGTGTSELFSDYEEGVWSPDLRDGAGGSVFASQSNDGVYVKSGSMVWASAALFGASTSSSTDIVTINLPFAASSSKTNAAAPLVYSVGLGSAVAAYVQDGGSYLKFTKTIGSIGSNVLCNEVTTGLRGYFSIVYATV